MNSKVKRLLSVIAGFVAASAVMLAVEAINGHVLYPDLGAAAQGMTDPEAIRALLAAAPVGAMLVVLLGWALGGFAGGWSATRLSGEASQVPAVAVAVILTLGVIANNLMIPPPIWFWLAGLCVPGPCALLGGRMAGARAL